MNRRPFLLRLPALCAFLLGGGTPLFARGFGLHCSRVDSYSDLPIDLQALYSPDFVRAFPDSTLDDLFEALRVRRVYTREKFDIARIRDNAANDPLVEFNDFFWTESELMLYALVARLRGKEEGRRGVVDQRARPIVSFQSATGRPD